MVALEKHRELGYLAGAHLRHHSVVGSVHVAKKDTGAG